MTVASEHTKTPALVLERLSKRFDRLLAVDHIDLRVEAGEIYGFLGPNGAGKTTTIKLIAGLLLPSSGSLFVCGHSMKSAAAACRGLTGYIPDRPYLYEKLTGAEYLRFISSLYPQPDGGSGESLRRADEYLRLFDIFDRRHKLIESYSHGMRQKLIMSSIFMLNRPLIVVDEPMVGLDPKSARIVKELFRDEAARGTAIFLSTHSMEIAEELCDRISIITNGTIIASGTIDTLKKKAEHGAENLEELFLQLTGAFELQRVIAALQEAPRPGEAR